MAARIAGDVNCHCCSEAAENLHQSAPGEASKGLAAACPRVKPRTIERLILFQGESYMSMAKTQCTDRVVGAILASWRYDISGISPEMRKDYEQHFADCSPLQRPVEIPSQPRCIAGCSHLAFRLFFLFALAVLQAHQAPGARRLQHPRPRHRRHLPHAGFGGHRGRLLLAHCVCRWCSRRRRCRRTWAASPRSAHALEERLPEAFKSPALTPSNPCVRANRHRSKIQRPPHGRPFDCHSL